MDILTTLDPGSEYSTPKLQLFLIGWVLSSAFSRNGAVSTADGNVDEGDYSKQSLYSLLYSMYRSIGEVKTETGEPFELTFNTWGYAWPEDWGSPPTTATDPEKFGKNAYSGLFEFAPVKEYVRQKNGRVHVVEMGCGTGAGAHQICANVLQRCTYEAVDMQQAAIQTCRRKFVPRLGNRLVATRADCTQMSIHDDAADIVVVCETHVTEHAGEVGDEDKRFFGALHRVLKPGGYFVWGNAIPDATWQPCFDYLDSIGLELVEARDVTKYAVLARDQDQLRTEAYVDACLDHFWGFRIPFLGARKRLEANFALKNFYRNPGTTLYNNMKDGTDTYKVVLLQKTA